jgi:REP element-mobilizing transposase RayT
MLRGNGGQKVFVDSVDRSRFLLLLQQCVERYHCRVHAYCLMDNHLHLAVQVADVSLSKTMQSIGFRYTQYMNRRYKTAGHLFQGRFKALLIDADSYLLELVRYIHLNPMRAGMVKSLSDHPWSSHVAYLGRANTPWLTTDWVLGCLDTDMDRAIERYQLFVLDGFEEGHRKEFHCGTFEGRVLGDDSFIEDVCSRTETRVAATLTIDDILEIVCKRYGISLAELIAPGRQQPFAEARAVSAWLVRQCDGLELKALADRLNRELSGLSHAASRLEQRMTDDVGWRERLTGFKAVCFSQFVKPDP